MDTVHTRYGEIPVAGCLEWHDNGALMSCAPAGPMLLETPHGVLPVQHSTDDLRRRTVQALHFHRNGLLKHLPLEAPTEIQTPAGRMRAELVTFHANGALARAFPLNGKLSGYWTQEDEGRLAGPVTLATPLGSVTARVIGVSFCPEGTLRSLTLWPGEVLDVLTPAGVISTRTGISFRPDGSLRSVEPARPVPVTTPVGVVQAFDLDACGIHGDSNSLAFTPDGSVRRVATSLTQIVAVGPDKSERRFRPASRESLCGDAEREPVPMWLEFSPEMVLVRAAPDAKPVRLSTAGQAFRTTPHLEQFANPFGKMGCTV
ncbi:MAG: hypothetical protein KKA55_12610 [Proteobacteria bacterium]|nr:hypothetical protein [Pseudomonadota bacterium]MBU1596359.1 hypothetical protein [Pseudomonadota bacterium]